jgi:hypothetical protein
MREFHIPTSIFTPEDLEKADLSRFNVLVLPGVKQLERSAVERLETYVRNGGGLVITYPGEAASEKFAKLMGIRARLGAGGPVEGQVPPQVYYKVSSNDPLWRDLNGRLLSFVGGRYEENEYDEDVRVAGEILGYDFTRMSLLNLLTGTGYPGRPLAPLVVLRDVGKGRVVYIAADLLITNCPASVEVLVYSSPRRMVILLLNQTTNQYINDPIRYVVPLRDLEVAVKLGASAPNQISSLSGQDLNHKIANGWLTVSIGQLVEREAVMVDFPTP